MRSFILGIVLFTVVQLKAQSVKDYENFHEIHPGKYYRSAQMFPQDLEYYIKKHGIKTVINLRGENPGEDWFDWQSEVVDRLGVRQVNIGMSAGSLPHKKNLVALLEAFKNAPRPLLVHCKAGADRTGEASAIYQMLYMNKSKSEALKMLTLRYGHGKWFKPAKTYFIDKVWKGQDWAYNEYNPCTGQYKYYNVNSSECKE